MRSHADTVSWLSNVPSSDSNFKAALDRATPDEIRQALDRTRGKAGHTTRTKVLERRLRKLEKQAP